MDKQDQSNNRGLATIIIVGAVLCIAALLFINRKRPIPSMPTACISNVKQLAIGFLMYDGDYDDQLPKSSSWGDLTYPYIKNKSVYKCPEVQEGYGYAMNGHYSQAKTAHLKDPEKLIILFESTDLAWNASSLTFNVPDPSRHGTVNNFGFMDGHAKGIKLGSSYP